MDIHAIRQQLKTTSIYDLPLRVSFYARVSSESDEQRNSLGNQIAYYQAFIQQNQNWDFVTGYVDEGLSGATTKNREQFHAMVSDAQAGKFDLILTKEITRFARNTLDSIQYTRTLLQAGVGVFFQNDNINTLDEDSELRLTIMSGIAQDELRKLSSRVKFGHQQAIKKSVVLGNSRIFGYRKEGGRLVIDPEQALMVATLFDRYATGAYSLKGLETYFWQQGYRNYNGKKIAHTTLSGILSNPKYKGYYVGNKVKVVDLFTKKQKFLPPEEWVMFKDETGEIVPAIVTEAVWEAANQVLKRRSMDVKNRQGICNHKNLLTGKLHCTHCGAPYYRRDSGRGNSKWVCSGKVKNGAESCPSFPIYEAELKPLLLAVFHETKLTTAALVEEYLGLYQSLASDDGVVKKLERLQETVSLVEKKKSKLLTYNAMGELSDLEFLAMNRQCAQEIAQAKEEITALELQRHSEAEFQGHMDALRKTLQQAALDAKDKLITPAFVGQYIDSIQATVQEEGVMALDVRLATGETTQTYLENLRQNAVRSAKWVQRHAGCTGHMCKKMIESYEKNM